MNIFSKGGQSTTQSSPSGQSQKQAVASMPPKFVTGKYCKKSYRVLIEILSALKELEKYQKYARTQEYVIRVYEC